MKSARDYGADIHAVPNFIQTHHVVLKLKYFEWQVDTVLTPDKFLDDAFHTTRKKKNICFPSNSTSHEYTSPEIKATGGEGTARLHLVPTLRMRGVIPPFPPVFLYAVILS
jgi:hypothetical protein